MTFRIREIWDITCYCSLMDTGLPAPGEVFARWALREDQGRCGSRSQTRGTGGLPSPPHGGPAVTEGAMVRADVSEFKGSVFVVGLE